MRQVAVAGGMNILLFGSTGQVGREVLRRVPRGSTITALTRSDADLVQPEGCVAAIRAAQCDAIVNAAAYTAVDRAEDEEELAQAINGLAAGVIAREAAAKGVPLVQLSTDYVFSGTAGPYAPDAAPGPVNAYGRSKLAGENAVKEAGGQYAILRTSWVFSAHGSNFVKTMLRLGNERSEMRVVTDQLGGPTPAAAIVDAAFAIAAAMHAGEPGGTFHFSGAPDTNWAGFARAIFAEAAIDCTVTDIATADYPSRAARPLDSRLDCTGIERFGLARPDWKTGLREVLDELGESG